MKVRNIIPHHPINESWATTKTVWLERWPEKTFQKPRGKKKRTTGNLGRNQAQAPTALPTRLHTSQQKHKKKNSSVWCRPRMIAHVQSQA